jgi:hypothetical protein
LTIYKTLIESGHIGCRVLIVFTTVPRSFRRYASLLPPLLGIDGQM